MDSDSSSPSSDSEVPDRELENIRKVLHSLDPDEYIEFMKEVHCNCPFKTQKLTDKIIQHWTTDHSIRPEEFNKIIDERDAEHIKAARERRQGDLIRIQDMKSRTGLDPLQLFPKEIWMMILDELPPEGKRSFREVHATFWNLTNDESVVIGDSLFPMIVGFRVEQPFWRIRFRLERPIRVNNRILPNPKIVSPLAMYTPLRLLSKSMRNAVDRWFEDDLISKLRSGDENASPSIVVCANLQFMRHCRKFARIKAHLYSSSDPPKCQRFFTRSLHILSPSVNDLRDHGEGEAGQLELSEFPANMDKILDEIGHQIWYFHADIRHNPSNRIYEPDFAERYSMFNKLLGKMPNLKWLKVTINQNENISRHGLSIPEESLPALIHLERLDLGLVEANRYVLPVFNQILTAYSHVKILNLLGMKSILKEKNGFVNLDEVSAKIPLSLEVLIMHGTTSIRPDWNDNDSSDDEETEHNFGLEDENDFRDSIIFQSIIDSKWRLRRIEWEIRSGVNAAIILRSLGYIPTLEKVRLSLENITIRNDSGFPKLPLLEHFELKFKKFDVYEESTDNWSFFFSLQSLLYADKLKTLIWKCDMMEEGWKKVKNDTEWTRHCGEILDFNWLQLGLLGFVECKDISYSNIWTVWRSLETVMVELAVNEDRDSYGEYNKFVSKKFRRCDINFDNKSSDCSSSSSESLSGPYPIKSSLETFFI